jgi:hypothetical protein
MPVWPTGSSPRSRMPTAQVLGARDALEVIQTVLLAARVSIVQHFGIGSGSRT